MELDYFHPEPASKFVDSVHGLTTLSDENPITDVLTHFNEVLQDMDMTLPMKDVKNGEYDLEDPLRKTADRQCRKAAVLPQPPVCIQVIQYG